MEKKRKRFGLLLLILIILFLFFLFTHRTFVSPLPEQHGIMLELISPSVIPTGIEK
jgi:hypothetical protein